MPIVHFQEQWKVHFPWVKEGKQKWTAQCILCNSSFSFDGMGRSALTSHAKGKKHRSMENIQKNNPLIVHSFQSTKISNNQPSTSSSQPPALNSDSQPQTEKVSQTLDKFKLKDSVTEKEVIWCIHTVMTHLSLRSSESTVLLLSNLFQDSAVAKEIKLHKDKISYSIAYGIAPYFKDLLKLSLMEDTSYVIGFDESFNEVAQRTQMDLSVRFWSSSNNEVKSRYLGSVFLNEAKATNLLEAFKTGIDGLDTSKIIQISMDGPNVNWAFLKLIKEELNTNLGPDAPQLLQLGSCGLHVVHGAFKTGITKTGWQIIQFLRAMYNLFKMVPARRGHFTDITGSKLFPLQFCTIRWVENSTVTKRAIEILPNLKKYVDAVQENSKKPTCNSFQVVESGLKDKLLLAKLGFFQSLAEELEPFLKEFQTDGPMVPFLYDSLVGLLKRIMNRFVKKEEMDKKTFFKVDVFEKKDGLFKSLLKVKEIDLGYATKSALRKCTGVTDKEIIEFRKDVRTCYQFLVSKVQEKSPLKYPLTKAVSFLNPALISDESQLYNNLQETLEIMVEANIISAPDAEKADREFKEVVCKPHFKIQAEKYNRSEEKLDKFWSQECEKTESLKTVVKKILILSHGNATLERGFSINKEILVENMREDSIVAQRIIYDAISDAGGLKRWMESPFPKKLTHSMRNA